MIRLEKCVHCYQIAIRYQKMRRKWQKWERFEKHTEKHVPVNWPASHGPPSFRFSEVEFMISGLQVAFASRQQILQTSSAVTKSSQDLCLHRFKMAMA